MGEINPVRVSTTASVWMRCYSEDSFSEQDGCVYLERLTGDFRPRTCFAEAVHDHYPGRV